MSSDKTLKLRKLIVGCIPNSNTLGQGCLKCQQPHPCGREVGCRMRIFFPSSNTGLLSSIFVFCCCVTGFYKLGPKTIHTGDFSICRSEVQAWHSWALCSKCHQAEIQAPAGQHSQLEFRVLFQAHSSCQQNSVPYRCRTEVLTFLLAGDQLSAPLSTRRSQLCMAQHSSLLLQNHQEHFLPLSSKTESHIISCSHGSEIPSPLPKSY